MAKLNEDASRDADNQSNRSINNNAQNVIDSNDANITIKLEKGATKVGDQVNQQNEYSQQGLQRKIPDLRANLPTHADNPSDIDKLGRKPFAIAVASSMRYYLKHFGNTGSFLVHIYGAWGSGKSTLLKFLENELVRCPSSEPPNSWLIVWFNAWLHQRETPPWWSLMNSVYREALKELPLGRSIEVRIREICWRLWNSWSRTFWIAALTFGAIALAIFSGAVDTKPIQESAQSGGIDLLAFFSDKIVSGILATIVSIVTGIRAFGNSLLPGSPKVANEFTSKTSDPMAKIQSHFKEMVGWIRKPVAIFVDDLDRCNDRYTVEFMEGVQTIFRDTPNLAFVIAADRRWLYASYQQAYQSFTEALNEPGRPLGYLFLDKTFQISISLPRPSTMYAEKYLDYLITMGKSETEEDRERARSDAKIAAESLSLEQIAEILSKPEPNPVRDQAFREAVVEARIAQPEFEERAEKISRRYAALMEPNPRAILRFVNAFKLWRTKDILAGGYTEENKLVQWIVLSLRWPVLAQFLEENPELADTLANTDLKDWDTALATAGLEDPMRKIFREHNVGLVFQGIDKSTPLDAETIRKLTSV